MFTFRRILQLEEEYIQNICSEIIALKPDLLITEKGVSDLAQHYFVKAGISVIRRVRKSDNNRIARYVRYVKKCPERCNVSRILHNTRDFYAKCSF